MRYLIDGYNLLHALLGPPAGPQGLEAARQRLLDRLCELPQFEPTAVVVVFDALRGRPGGSGRSVYRCIQLHISQGETADDLIAELLRLDTCLQTLTVVSNDHRLQTADRRRPCAALACLDWVEQMKQPRRAERAAEPA